MDIAKQAHKDSDSEYVTVVFKVASHLVLSLSLDAIEFASPVAIMWGTFSVCKVNAHGHTHK